MKFLSHLKNPTVIGVTAVIAVSLLWLHDKTPFAPQVVDVADAGNKLEDAAQASTEPADLDGLSVATLAGGCFWCMESTFEKINGVREVVSGYTAGKTKNPTYAQVGGGGTGHTEAVEIYYDPAVISYRALLHAFWREIDPTDAKGQFVDRGDVYRPGIFYHNEQEKSWAIASRDALRDSGRFGDDPLAVEITPAQTFYRAEEYHQDYYKNHAYRYKIYRHGSGRDQFLTRVWGKELHAPYPGDGGDGKNTTDTATDASDVDADATRYTKPDDAQIKTALNSMQYRVTQHDATEPPFNNEYWDNKVAGIYVDIVSGEPLFSSTDKYKSGTGWPSFSRPIDPKFMVKKTDYKLLYPRTELRSKYGDSHLGHVFNDGPAPTGLRYCINSASLRFIAATDLEQAGYAQYSSLFK